MAKDFIIIVLHLLFVCGSGINLTLCVENGCKRKKKVTRIMFLRKSFLNAEISSVELINPSIKKDKLGEGYGIVLYIPDN